MSMQGNFYFELNPSLCIVFYSLPTEPSIWIAPFDLNEIANILADQAVNWGKSYYAK